MERGIRIRLIKDKLFNAAIYLLSFLSLLPLLLVLFLIFSKGLPALSWELLTHLPKPVGEGGGGVANGIIGTLVLMALAGSFSVPLGIAAGVYLSEYKNTRLSYITRLGVDILQGIPSIVMGIVVYLWVVRPMEGFSALAGGVALGLMMLPLVVRSSEEILKLVPFHIKEASLALGVPYYRTVLKVIIPAGLPGIVSGILLGLSRIAGETAPLLFTAFGNPFMNLNILKPINALPLVIFNYAMSPYTEWHTIAWGASVVLISIVLLGEIFSRVIIKRWKVQF